MFTPTRPGTARAQLTLQGTGSPLTAQLRPVAFALPAVTRLTAARRRGCVATPGALVSATVSQAATVHWTLTRAAAAGHGVCPRPGAPAGRVVASGAVRTGGHGTGGHGTARTARWSLPRAFGGLTPGAYMLTVSAVNGHGAGPLRAMALRLGP
jgi:hypothetical protein